jgi:glycosyltransferase 2 family protein
MARRGRIDRLQLVQLALAAAGVVVLVVLARGLGVDVIRTRLSQIDPPWIAAYLAVEAVLFCGYTLRWRSLLRGLDEDLSFRRLFGARLAGLAIGSLTPGAKLGGEPLRAYMVARDGVRAGPAIASVVVDRGVELVANVVFGVAYCAVFALRDRTAAGQVLLVIAASGLALAAGVAVMARRLRRGASLVPERFVPVIERVGGSREVVRDSEDSMRRLFFGSRRLLGWAIGVSLVLNALVLAEYAALFAVFGAHPSLPELAGTLLGVGFAHALPVPASIGALEGAQAVVVRIGGGGPEQALVSAAVARIRDVVWTVPGLVVLALRGLHGERAGLTARRAAADDR